MALFVNHEGIMSSRQHYESQALSRVELAYVPQKITQLGHQPITTKTTQATPCDLWLLTKEKPRDMVDRWFQEKVGRVERTTIIALINVTKG